jgi:hypothetical protein
MVGEFIEEEAAYFMVARKQRGGGQCPNVSFKGAPH